MYARLAFAVAVHVDPDVLLVDEVLSVGDAAFQDRSLRRMLEFRDQGRAAIVFVSHNLAAVELMCQRAVWLDRGAVRASGPTSEVIRAYLDAVDDEATTATATRYLTAERVEVLDCRGRPTQSLRARRAVHRARRAARRCATWSSRCSWSPIRGDHGPLFAGNMHIDGNWPAGVAEGPFAVECAFGPPGLSAGSLPSRAQGEAERAHQLLRAARQGALQRRRRGADGDVALAARDVPYAIIGGC